MSTIIVSLENYSVGSYCACILLILSGPWMTAGLLEVYAYLQRYHY